MHMYVRKSRGAINDYCVQSVPYIVTVRVSGLLLAFSKNEQKWYAVHFEFIFN